MAEDEVRFCSHRLKEDDSYVMLRDSNLPSPLPTNPISLTPSLSDASSKWYQSSHPTGNRKERQRLMM
jgi:hypothetical protein